MTNTFWSLSSTLPIAKNRNVPQNVTLGGVQKEFPHCMCKYYFRIWGRLLTQRRTLKTSLFSSL